MDSVRTLRVIYMRCHVCLDVTRAMRLECLVVQGRRAAVNGGIGLSTALIHRRCLSTSCWGYIRTCIHELWSPDTAMVVMKGMDPRTSRQLLKQCIHDVTRRFRLGPLHDSTQSIAPVNQAKSDVIRSHSDVRPGALGRASVESKNDVYASIKIDVYQYSD